MARTMRRAAERSRNPQKHHGGGKHRPTRQARAKRPHKQKLVKSKMKASAKAKRGK